VERAAGLAAVPQSADSVAATSRFVLSERENIIGDAGHNGN